MTSRQTPFRARVHPRLRGEHSKGVGGDFDAAGSSPLTRGTPARCACPWPWRRFIPAYAGNTPAHPARRRGPPVHPRLRGEHCMWSRTAPNSAWFIPAYAGNTGADGRCKIAHAVHPRLRGEHLDQLHLQAQLVGSSPLTRGTRRRAGCDYRPAAVHPRLRGEHSGLSQFGDHLVGSSPLTRGTLCLVVRHGGKCRFIPAYAGNTPI